MAGDFSARSQLGASGALSFNHTGRPLAMAGLCLKILLLGVVTLTIYRFWGRTEVRRYLWGHTVIDGEPLDYLGKGSELLIGFLVALVLYLFPLGAAFQAILYFYPISQTGAMQPAGGIAFLAFDIAFLYLVAVGLYQALRYRLSRTAWRGVRFALKGSAFGFGAKFLLLGFLNVITLGLLTPVMDLALFRTVANNTYFGDKAFRFEGKARSLYGSFLLSYVLVLLLTGGVGAAIIGYLAVNAGVLGQTQGPPSGAQVLAMLPVIYAAFIGLMLLILVSTSFYAARSLRVKGSGLRFEGLGLALDAHSFSYLWLTLSNLVLITVTFGIALPITELRRFQYIFRRLTSEGSINLASIGQSAGPVPRFGEGLAEAFGLGNV